MSRFHGWRGGMQGWYGRHRHDIDNFLVTYPRLMWIREWLQKIFENEENLQNQVTELGNATIKAVDTASIDLTVVDEPLLEVIKFNPISEEEEIKYIKEQPSIQADVNISEKKKDVTVGEEPYIIEFEAENANEIIDEGIVDDEPNPNNGVWAPDYSPLLGEIYKEVKEIEKNIEETSPTVLTTANFNDLTSFGLSFTGLNYHSFFEKETGVYFAYSGTTTQTALSRTFTGNVLAVFDKVGNLLSFISLEPLKGQVIGNILNVFVSYSKRTGDYYIEIGCDNESAYAFVIAKDIVFINSLNVNKTVSITEFNSMQTFNTIIGSEDTSIPGSGDVITNWYNQQVTIWNTLTNSFLYGTRRDLYDSSSLTVFKPDVNVDITTTTSLVGASADYYGNLVAVYNTASGQKLGFFTTSTEENTLVEVMTRDVQYPNAGGNGTTLITYSKRVGALETLDSTTEDPQIYGVQILNQAKDVSNSTKEWSILLNHSRQAINDSTTSYVAGFGNSSASITNQLLNSEGVGIDEILQISNNFRNYLAGISMQGEFNVSQSKLYGIDFTALYDTPDKQSGLTIKGYSDAVQFGLKNSKVALNRFTQVLYWSRTADNPAGGVFDETVIVKAYRRVILESPYQGSPNPGSIGEWVIVDADSLNSSINNIVNGLQNIVNNLYESGAITTNNIYNFEFKPDRNIATGNINLFSNVQDGSSFIRTNQLSNENDLFAG